MSNSNWETDRGPNREASWNREQPRHQPGWPGTPPEQFQGNWRQQRGPESDWREGFRGGFGNSGQMSKTAYNPGGLGMGHWESTGVGNEFSERSGWGGYRGDAHGAEGPYSGRGPRGYQRSDERVHEDVCDRLTEHGGIDASGIEVACERGEITLEGTVPDRRSKRLAEEVAESARGVRDVHNRLRVSGGDAEQGRSFGTESSRG